MKRIWGTDSKISSSTNRIYYLCQQELYKLMDKKFLFEINNEKMNQQQVKLLKGIERQSNLYELLIKFKKELMWYDVDYITDKIIQIFVNMINYKQKKLGEREAEGRINMLKRGSLQMNNNVHALNDMLMSFNWSNKFVVYFYFTANIISLKNVLVLRSRSV